MYVNGSKKHIGDDCYYTSPFCAEKVFGMYLGDSDSIETVHPFLLKTLTSLAGAQRVYLDPKSKYPRFKTKRKATTIKRSLTAAKADVCRLPKKENIVYIRLNIVQEVLQGIKTLNYIILHQKILII